MVVTERAGALPLTWQRFLVPRVVALSGFAQVFGPAVGLLPCKRLWVIASVNENDVGVELCLPSRTGALLE